MEKRINKGKGFITISTTVSPDFYMKAQKYNISWAAALRRGLSLIFSELGDTELNNPFQMTQKVEALAQKLNEIAQQKAELEIQLETIKK